MSDLSPLEEKLGEVMGLAQAATEATRKVRKLVKGHDDIARTLEQMSKEAKETAERCADVAGDLPGKKTAVQRKARETKAEAREMMKTYLSDDADALDGLEFLIMAEAGELGHVEIVRAINGRAGDARIRELVEWAQPIQQRHVEMTRSAALKLAETEAG